MYEAREQLIEKTITTLTELRSRSQMAAGNQWSVTQIVIALNRRRDFVDPSFQVAAQYLLDLVDPGMEEDELREVVKAFVSGVAFGVGAAVVASERGAVE